MTKKITLFAIITILLLIPLIMNGNLYYLGGDDMRLYYIYPEKYLENYVFNLIGGNTLAGANTGYATVAYYAPMFYFIKLLKLVPLNTQFLMYGLNLSFGFLFFYKFLGLYIKKGWIIKVVSALFYILSPFLIATYYRNQMLSMYLISIIPICIYLFISSVREHKYYLSVMAILVFSIFSTTVNTLPWWSAFIIPTLLLLFFEFVNHKLSFLINTVIVIILFAAINSYWIIDFIKSQWDNGGLVNGSYYSSEAFIADNFRVMQGVSTLFNPLHIIFNNPQIIFERSDSILTYANILFFLIIILAGILVSKFKKTVKTNYFTLLTSFLISWYLFSPNIGVLGPKIFLSIGRNFPLFSMYRNMFDKFSLPLAFYFAAILAVSLAIVKKRMPKLFNKSVLFAIILLTLFNSKNFLIFSYSPEQEISRLSGEFNDDFNNLASYIKGMDNKSKVLWLPLNYPTYVNIEDKHFKGHFYLGLSPLRIITDRSDYAGGFSFITQINTSVSDELKELIKNQKYEEIGKLFQKMNARFIIVDKQQLPEFIKPYMYGGEELALLTYQNKKFMDNYLGNKLANFGERYDLYEIKPEFKSDLIYITDSVSADFQENDKLKYKKISNHKYELTLQNIEKNDKLVFLEAYNKRWKLLEYEADKLVIPEISHQAVFGYANLWEMGDSLESQTRTKSYIIQFVK